MILWDFVVEFGGFPTHIADGNLTENSPKLISFSFFNLIQFQTVGKSYRWRIDDSIPVFSWYCLSWPQPWSVWAVRHAVTTADLQAKAGPTTGMTMLTMTVGKVGKITPVTCHKIYYNFCEDYRLWFQHPVFLWSPPQPLFRMSRNATPNSI